MAKRDAAYRGCLLGLAVGDAMGCAVDRKSWDEIVRDYGPNGLLGYDLVNGYADVSSYTQLTAYCANGLLAGLTRGQMRGRMAPFVRYAEVAIREWGQVQHTRRTPDQRFCWISQVPQLRMRRCMDTRMLDTLSRDRSGTPEEPINHHDTPGILTAAVPVGLFFDPVRMDPNEIGRLGAEIVALTHGEPLSFLSGAVIAYAVAGIVQDPDTALKDQFLLYTFGTALILCTVLCVVKKQRFTWQDALWGLALGIPNYFSARFLLLSLGSVPAVVAYPTFSVGTIVAVTAVGMLCFRERLTPRKWIALGVILTALILLNI